jgi:PAT family beta-lactamase induction signal transducer AmpG
MTAPESASTSPEKAPARPPSWREGWAVYLQPRVLIVLLLGFSSGLPLALSGSTLLVWMRESGVDLVTIGLFAMVGTPYTLKFLWAPLVDALHVPFFTRAFGRRRGWLVFSQLLLIGSILLLALTDPARSPLFVALGALLVATMSSTQDIVVDAFRVESLPESEQAAGMASYVAAYRIGMLVSTAGALFVVTGFESTGITRGAAWMWGYVVMAALVLIGTITALVATEPEQSARAEAATHAESAFTRVLHAAVGAFSEFLVRKDALAALAFVVLFKFTDAFSGTMTAPFVIDLGFTRNDYAAIVKGVGLAATLIGGFAGGFVARRYSLTTSLWIGGVLQSVGAGVCDHGGELHQRHRHRDLRRLSLGAVPQSAAYRHAICAADGAGRGGADLPVVGRRLCGEGRGLADVLRDLRPGRNPEPDPARLAAPPRAF